MSELITGSDGQLGKALEPLYPNARMLSHDDIDIADLAAVRSLDWEGIDTIINAAAYTKVDEAETPAGKVAAWQANHQGASNLAAIATERDLTLIHISTDYVFDGTSKTPYTETDKTSPQSEYGKSKAAGDGVAGKVPKHYIVRTSWLIGDGNNFVRTMLKLGTERDQLTVVNDQIGRPTFTHDLAATIQHLQVKNPGYGIYNFSNGGEPVSWADFARAIFKQAQLDCAVSDVSTQEYFKNKDVWAPRPANSVLDLSKIEATGLKIRDWQTALAEYIDQELLR